MDYDEILPDGMVVNSTMTDNNEDLIRSLFAKDSAYKICVYPLVVVVGKMLFEAIPLKECTW